MHIHTHAHAHTKRTHVPAWRSIEMCKSTGRELTPEQEQMLAEFEEADDEVLDQSGVLNVDFGKPETEEESTWLEHLSEEDECATEGDKVDQALCQAWAAESSSDGPGAAEAAMVAAPSVPPASAPAPPPAQVSPPPAPPPPVLSSPTVDPGAVQLARMLERDRAAAVQLLEKRTGGAQLTLAETSELRAALASLIYELTS